MITYTPRSQTVHFSLNGFSENFQPSRPVEIDGQVFEPPARQPADGLQKAICDMVWSLPASDQKAVFNPQSATIRYGSDTITPDSDLTAYPADIQAFVNAIYSFNNGEQRSRWEGLQLEVIEEQATELTPEQLAAIERAKIIDQYRKRMDSITAGYTQQEINTFFQKAREAAKVLAGETEGTPFIDRFAERMGLTREQVAQSIQANEAPWSAAAADAEAEKELALAALGA